MDLYCDYNQCISLHVLRVFAHFLDIAVAKCIEKRSLQTALITYRSAGFDVIYVCSNFDFSLMQMMV